VASSKAKQQLTREHLTDQQWEDFSRVAEFILNWKRRKLAETCPAVGKHQGVSP
jgi:hypothetical protein